MKPIFSLAVAALAFVGIPAPAQTPQQDDTNVEVTPGKVEYYSKMRREATVASIDHASRKFSLQLADGQVLDLTAEPEVKNFDKVKVGDKVVANYEERLDLSVLKDGKEAVGRREESASTAGQGENPGAQQTKKVTLTGDVVKVDEATGVVSVRGATQILDLTIRDPKQLALIKVGDQIQAVTTQTLALSLEPAK